MAIGDRRYGWRVQKGENKMELSPQMLTETRMQTYQNEQMFRIKNDLTPDSGEKAAKAAVDFEAMLIKQMLSEMTKGLEGEGFFGTQAGNDFYQDMFLQQISLNMATRQSFGIAESILKQVNPDAIKHLTP